jgi:hypothetical protein
MKAIFKNDYSWKSGVSCGEGVIGCAPEEINYKKGDSFEGLTLLLSNDKKQVVAWQGNFTVTIPVENFTILNDDGTPVNTSSTDLAPESFLQKNKTNLLIIGLLVLGYLAYKKFNK